MSLTSTLSGEALPGLAEALARRGWELRSRPLLRFLPPLDWSPVDAALRAASRFGAIALTSPRAAAALRRRAGWLGTELAELPPLWAVGPATAAAVGWPACVPATPGGGGALAAAMLEAGVRGPVLHLTTEEHRPEPGATLRARGMTVEELGCYRVEHAKPGVILTAMAGGHPVLIVSHRVLTAAARLLPPPARPPLVALGPRTAEAAMARGWTPLATAVAPTIPGIVAALGDPTPGPAGRYGATLR